MPATAAAIQKKVSGSGTTALKVSKKEVEYILENS